MCRIFVSPSNTLTFKKSDLWGFFLRLEKVGGRDGNGVYNFTTKELWKKCDKMPIVANIDGGIMFHTRMATNGYVRDYNCQPFDTERYVLVHNGVFSDIENYARLLGFNFSEKKYSDSWMMSFVVEKVGIWDFYNAIKDEYFGVIVIYDKKVDKIYLLKGSGGFTYAKFEGGTHIYASSLLDYWKIDGKPESFDNGLYILRDDGFTTLYKKAKTYSYSGKYSGRYGGRSYYGGYDYYKDELPDKTKKKIITVSTDEKEEEPTGIGALFSTPTNEECISCKWLYGRKCWFGGIEREGQLQLLDANGVRTECNSEKCLFPIVINCNSCNITLNNEDDWSIYNEAVVCDSCIDFIETWGLQCENCKHYRCSGADEPCISCWKDEKPTKWEINDNESCKACLYELMDKTVYPCRDCVDDQFGMSLWEGGESYLTSCFYCGIELDLEDGPPQTEAGDIVCPDCFQYGSYATQKELELEELRHRYEGKDYVSDISEENWEGH